MVIWVTGLSGSGKTTLCECLRSLLKPDLPELVLLDGDLVRLAFGHDLGYQEEDRVVQVKRIRNLAKMLSEQGLVVLVAVLYSNPELMAWNRKNIKGYFEVYLEASVETLKRRDTKNLYQGAIEGSLRDVVGVDIPWHAPQAADLVMNTDHPEKPEVMAQRVVSAILALGRRIGVSTAMHQALRGLGDRYKGPGDVRDRRSPTWRPAKGGTSGD